MSDSPATRATLLIKVRDSQDQVAWNQFVEIYAPLIHRYGLHRGLQDADAADLAQDVLESIAGAVKSFEYDPDRGSFRGWLFTITLNKLRRMMTKRGKQERGSGETAIQAVLHEQPGRESDEDEWNRQHQLRLFHWAAEQVRDAFEESTWTAFWQTAVENEAAPNVAERLGITAGAVHIAKSRVLARIRLKIQSVEEE